ncbi:hypothetical protein GCM10023201_40720 [Actinomycetospora corticicola]|uniref:Uncharacterized protein n=1 Tax=Actinomycetospora corticicola TaxID=663602 RepID=A0A7Y9DWM2_9PSEU|nr:heparin lyase I family protein [Actinomycetospora corticicola]NYD36844.1 hypothetical protein [Actinomycetospora corticicola]
MGVEEQLLDALMGKADGSIVDQLDAALAAAWAVSTGMDLVVAPTGGTPGPFHPGGGTLDLALDQVAARWGAAPKARTMVEKAALLEQLVRGIAGKRTPANRPSGTPAAGGTSSPSVPSSGWRALSVLTAKAATGERSSFQSAVPSWGEAGMTVSLLAKGDRPGTPNRTSGGDTQRCEILLAGWESLTGTQFLRYDFTLADGFPVDTTDWQVIAQLKNSSTGSPPLEVMVGRGQVYLQWHDAGGRETGREVLGKATTGVRHSVVLQVPFTTGKATVRGWFDGAESFQAEHGPTQYPGQGSYGKLGLYRSNRIGKAATVVHHGVARGSSLAAVTS